MKTYFPKTDEIAKDWHLINAEGATLGKLAAQIAMMLRGKTKPTLLLIRMLGILSLLSTRKKSDLPDER